MGKKWQGDRKREYYYKKAKSEDYRSRASFKLKQINKKFKLIKRGDSICDLGAAPGGWMQMAAELTGETGIVVGVDLEEIEPFTEENIIAIHGDMTLPETIDLVKSQSVEYDVVISDASPDISGAWDVDHYNSITLSKSALNTALELLREGGNFVVKVFQGNTTKELFTEVKRSFQFAKIAKPDASRRQSSEVYIVGKGLLKTPVRYGDKVTVKIVETGRDGDGVAYHEGFKIIVEDSRIGETASVKIKKVTHKLAFAVKD
ncbi:ribosomal RNA large subunit methyltransferase E [archaeon BMS3Abin16]|nr:ribosomal RNA large subunit methyltransferase E [archaeon BMS3Abin16]GBE56109.1 ribosomal RNA large subunit methyltransferase E [archaeon BMS3Bbin16]